MTTYDGQRRSRGDQAERANEVGAAPGKRTLTQRLPGSLGQAMARQFDGSMEYMESRLTIEAPPQLDPHQLRRARRKNPRYQRELGFDPAAWSAAPIDSDEFAAEVAALQARAGLRVDGIVGPETAASRSAERQPPAPPGAPPATGPRPAVEFDPTGDYMESRATVDGPAETPGDDPFGLHLIDL